VTAMHGHYAFWGAYDMFVLAIISIDLPNLTGRKRHDKTNGQLAFWLSNIGMLGMVVALGVAGVVQVYLERRLSMDFMVAQEEVKIHFVVMLLCATLFSIGIGLYIYEFIRYGRPTDEAVTKKEEAVLVS
ncbi:MAG TPA: cbb3-type cytochrome c oxidase subunit I, partial [Lunatimonas sp.]|nr:cbb3-type cytochrome c oxidase subunit I [Lunatimonas sp.]